MKQCDSFLAFTLEQQRVALPLAVVDEVIGAVEITPLPKAPAIVLGVINRRGRVVAVVNFRKRFGFAQRELQLSDRMILARTSLRPVAIPVDRVDSVISIDRHSITDVDRITPRTEYVEGVAKLPGDLLLIHDLSRFLSLDEESELAEALKGNTSAP
jgi:purine-binding chemotaxis protein CheW